MTFPPQGVRQIHSKLPAYLHATLQPEGLGRSKGYSSGREGRFSVGVPEYSRPPMAVPGGAVF